MGIRDIFRRKKTDDEAERRMALLRNGRITEGSIFDVITDETGDITHVFYNYEINGVEYESSQLLDAGQRLRAGDYFPGALVTIRFNPHQPGNSLVV
jgi:hypothetical protein